MEQMGDGPEWMTPEYFPALLSRREGQSAQWADSCFAAPTSRPSQALGKLLPCRCLMVSSGRGIECGCVCGLLAPGERGMCSSVPIVQWFLVFSESWAQL